MNQLYILGKSFCNNRGMGENSVLCNGKDDNEELPYKIPEKRFGEEKVIDVIHCMS